MEDVFGDILRDNVMKAGGGIPARHYNYPLFECFKALDTAREVFITFDGKTSAFRTAAHLITLPSNAENVNVFGRDGFLVDHINAAGRQPSIFYYCQLADAPYTQPLNRMQEERSHPKDRWNYAINLAANPRGAIKCIELSPLMALAKFCDSIVSTSESAKLSYVSKYTLECIDGGIGNYRFAPLPKNIFMLPMEEICSKTVEALKAASKARASSAVERGFAQALDRKDDIRGAGY